MENKGKWWVVVDVEMVLNCGGRRGGDVDGGEWRINREGGKEWRSGGVMNGERGGGVKEWEVGKN